MIKVVDEIIETKVDKDILDFLKAVYFEDLTNPLKTASNRAYLDMNRTIRFKNLPNDIRLELRKEVDNIFEVEIPKIISGNITNQDKFDSWHLDVSNQIKQKYENKKIEFTYGQAQKWINMTIKYLYMLGFDTFNHVFQFLHIPLDNYVFEVAKKSFGIEKPKKAWSRLSDYKKEYIHYQKLIREKIVNETPLRWEFRNWLKYKQENKNK